MSFVNFEPDKWHRVDLRTVADDGKGCVEFWFNGDRKGCIKNQFTKNKKVRSLFFGVVNVSGNMTGDVFFDDITISDSLLE